MRTSELRCQLFATDLPILALRLVLADVAPRGAFWNPDTIDFVHDRLNAARRAEVRVVGGLDRQPLLARVLLAPVDEGAVHEPVPAVPPDYTERLRGFSLNTLLHIPRLARTDVGTANFLLSMNRSTVLV